MNKQELLTGDILILKDGRLAEVTEINRSVGDYFIKIKTTSGKGGIINQQLIIRKIITISDLWYQIQKRHTSMRINLLNLLNSI